AGSLVNALPAEVTLTFSEPVRAVAERIRVVAPDGSRVDRGTPAVRDTVLAIPLTPGTARGTYLISYRVISADSHPVAGGVTFSVGAPSAVPSAGSNEQTQVSGGLKVAMGVARWLGYVGVLLLGGPLLFLLGLWPSRLPRRVPARIVLA